MPESLAYILKGVDVVISTIGSAAQLALIEAAAAAQVRHFMPSAFSGPEQCAAQSIGQEAWQNLMSLLQHHEVKSSMRYTLFTCGAFYERFGPGGLNALQISTFNNRHAAIGEEGNLLIDIRLGKATIPVISDIEELAICMTSARDVARYVVATIQAYEEMSTWPREFKFHTERLTMSELVAIGSRVRGTYPPAQRVFLRTIQHSFLFHTPAVSTISPQIVHQCPTCRCGVRIEGGPDQQCRQRAPLLPSGEHHLAHLENFASSCQICSWPCMIDYFTSESTLQGLRNNIRSYQQQSILGQFNNHDSCYKHPRSSGKTTLLT